MAKSNVCIYITRDDAGNVKMWLPLNSATIEFKECQGQIYVTLMFMGGSRSRCPMPIRFTCGGFLQGRHIRQNKYAGIRTDAGTYPYAEPGIINALNRVHLFAAY